jgi:hypothetical protein
MYNARIPQDDVRRLLVHKAVEHRLLEPIEPEQLEPRTTIQYRVLFRPGIFKPAAEPNAEPPKPISRKEARGQALAGAILTTIFGGVTVYLAVFHRTWWALLPGFFSLGPLGLMVDGVVSWFAAIRRAKDEKM